MAARMRAVASQAGVHALAVLVVASLAVVGEALLAAVGGLGPVAVLRLEL